MIIKVDKSIYSKDVLLKTAFTFTDRAYIHLSQDKESWIISWKEREGADIETGMFENELIAQQLRERIIGETSEIRKLLLARAFASSVIEVYPPDNINPEDKTESGVDNRESFDIGDPQSILKGWFDP